MLANIKLLPIILFASFLSLQGCGGGGGSDTPNPSNPPIGNTDGGNYRSVELPMVELPMVELPMVARWYSMVAQMVVPAMVQPTVV